MNSDNLGNAPAAGTTQTTPASPFIAPKTDTTLSESLIVLRNRRLVVIAVTIIGMAIGVYRSLTQPKVYTSFGRIEVRSGSSNEYKLSAVTGMGDDPQRKLATEVVILTSDTLLYDVARDMNLANNATFFGSRTQAAHRNVDDPKVRQAVLATLRQNLTVSLVPKTDIIRIGYTSLDPKLSTDIVNTVIADYIQRSYQTRYESTQRVSRWLSAQLDDLKESVDASQQRLMDLQKKVGFFAFDATHNQISSSLDDLAKAEGSAKLARILAETRYRLLENMDPNSFSSSLDAGGSTTGAQGAGLLNILRGQLATARSTYAEESSPLGPNNATLKATKAQVDELEKEIAAEQNRLLLQAKETYLLAQANENQTQAALDAQKQDAFKLQDDMAAYILEQRTYEANRTLYEELQTRLRTAGITAGLESLDIESVDKAYPPASPTITPKSQIVLTSTSLGIIAGILLAFLLESLDSGLRSIAEIESITELPSLAIVPRAKRATSEQIASMTTVERNVSVLMQPKSQFTEAFRSLRTALMLSVVGREPKLILFTSATPSEGKTTTATNLAVILSQRGTRVLLIDADLRRPNVHHRFGLNAKLGLSTVLSGQTRLADSVQRVTEVPGLDILASGPVPPFPTEMLSSEAMSNVLREAGATYTHVVIDSPPVLSVTDGVVLSRQVDAVVMVVRHAKSSKHVVRRGRDLLIRSGAPLAGIVLNAVDLNAPEYYGYYGYTGYSYSSLDPAGWDAKSGANKKTKDNR